jgi:hypothetical protein
MNLKNVFIEILVEGTSLVKKVVSCEISIKEFCKTYGNYYYYNSLDGHEGGREYKALIKKYSSVIRLHKVVQSEVVDLVYFGKQLTKEEYLTAGRISPAIAMSRLLEVTNSFNLDKMLSVLSDETESTANHHG